MHAMLHVWSRVQVFLWLRRVYGGSCKTMQNLSFLKVSKQVVQKCRFVSQARHFRHSHVSANVSKVVLCGRHNNLALFSEDQLNSSWQAQHFGDLHRHFVWQACHFRCVALPALHYKLYTLHSALHTPPLNFTLYTPRSTLYTSHSTLTLHALHLTLHTLHLTLYTPHSTLHTLHTTLPTLHFTLQTLHSTLHTLHSTLYTHTLHSTLYTPHSTLHTLHSTPTLHTLHTTLPSLHVTLHTLHFTLRTLFTLMPSED